MITAEEERILAQETQEAIPEDDNYEAQQGELSEEDLLLKKLDKEHIEDYLEIYRAVRRTDLAEETVAFAVKMGLEGRK